MEATREAGDLVSVEVRAEFPNVDAFSNLAFSVGPSPAPAGGGPTWAFVTPRQILFKDGRFSARVLRASAPPRDDPIRASLRGHHARFTVVLPGEVSRADGVGAGSSVTWRFPLEALCDGPVEMNAVAETRSMAGSWLLGAALLAGLAVMIASLFRKKRA